MALLGLVLSTIGLVLPITTASLAADALSPGVRLMAQAAPSNHLAKSKPRPTSSRRQQIHGQVQSVHAPSLLFRADDGRMLTVDMSRVARKIQRTLAPGDGATLIGVPGKDPNHFVAQRIRKDKHGSDRLVEGGLSLPTANRYVRYDQSSDRYIEVDVASVARRVERGEWIYDQTAGAWVNHPIVGGRNPDYLTKSQKPSPSSGGSADAGRPTTPARVDASQAARLQRVMVPLNRVMDRPVPLDQVKVGITDDPQINAASGGGGQFFVTTGLLNKANDDQLRAILAHELAHQDLNHAGNAQVRDLGLSIGAAILGQIFPNSGAIAPLAGELVARKYGRDEEYAADRHGVELLRRAGYPKEMMINTLTWLIQTSGSDSGGFFATHPGTGDRIEVLRKMP